MKVIILLLIGFLVTPLFGIEKLYQEAYSNYQNGDFDQARSLFGQLIAKTKIDHLSDNAQFWIAMSYLKEGRIADSLGNKEQAIEKFSNALPEFEKVLSYKDNKTPKYTDSQFKIAQTLFFMKEYDRAELEFVKFVTRYPSHSLRKVCLEYINNIRKLRDEKKPTDITSASNDSTPPDSSGK